MSFIDAKSVHSMKYRIRFSGCPIGRLNIAMKDVVTRIVEADSPEAAKLKAYDTHEHITGGVDGVSVDWEGIP